METEYYIILYNEAPSRLSFCLPLKVLLFLFAVSHVSFLGAFTDSDRENIYSIFSQILKYFNLCI